MPDQATTSDLARHPRAIEKGWSQAVIRAAIDELADQGMPVRRVGRYRLIGSDQVEKVWRYLEGRSEARKTLARQVMSARAS